MSSDNSVPRGDVRWREAGIGIQPQRLCMGCNGKREPIGGRGVGVRWRCVACVAKRAQA